MGLKDWFPLIGLFLFFSVIGNVSGYDDLITKIKNGLDDLRRWVNKQ